MNLWTVGVAIQFACVLINGSMLLLNYSRYRRHNARLLLGLIVWNMFFLLFSGFFMIFDAGKLSGAW